MIEGWIVLVGGQGYPARVSEHDMAVAFFPDEMAAQQWIEQHPKAKNPYPIELKRSHHEPKETRCKSN